MGRDIGKKIRKLRIEGNMSQSRLAKKSGIAQSTLSYIERGKKVPQFNTLSSVCKGLGINIFKLLSYDEPKAKRKLFEQREACEYKGVSTVPLNSKEHFGEAESDIYFYRQYIKQKAAAVNKRRKINSINGRVK